jgi:CheY-like chemotaxis protein
MDVQMPGMDGLAATRRIRALPSPQRDVPIVGMSASASPSQAAAFREAGMSGHIDKPFRREDLQAAVERWRRLELPKSEPGPNASLQALDRAVYDSLFDLVGRERVMVLLGQLATQLTERFVGEPVSAEDRARLARDAHAMISAAGVLGFLVLSGACKSLAAACAAGGDIGVPLDRVRASRAMTLKTISALKQAA